MAISIDGTNGITLPSGSTAVGTTDTQSLTNKTIGSGYGGSTIVADTAKNSTSGTNIDFTGIPSWVKRVTVMFSGVSTSGTSPVLIQLGTSGGVTTSGYLGAGFGSNSVGVAVANYTTGFGTAAGSGQLAATSVRHGSATFINQTGNTWVGQGVFGHSDSTSASFFGGTIALSGTLDRLRVTTVNGTDTFDAGSINILYE